MSQTDQLIEHQGSGSIPPSNDPPLAHAMPGDTRFPKGARLINLREDSKAPASSHGHKDAVPQDEFVQTGTNVGIVLDGMFLLVDIDHEENSEARLLSSRVLEEGPRVHKTPRGHHFLFRVPPEWSGSNVTLRDNMGKQYGDIKALGYAVGPGSKINGALYSVDHDVEPPEAPQWLLDLAVKPSRAEVSVEERDGIPYGEHDHFLVRLAGYLRGREGLSKDAIRGVLEAGPLGVLDSYDDTHPYTERDLARIATSAARYETHQGEYFDLSNPLVMPATGVQLVSDPIEWHVRGFIPCGELVLMYGPGGIGKSSMGSWLCSETTKKHRNFLYVGTEEAPARFLGRARLAGADLTRARIVQNPGVLKFPRDASKLREMIVDENLEMVYIDSIYSHFEHKEGQNAAEKARDALAPLLAISHETGCTIFGVFHTNKAGAFLGSTEMENVARCLLEAKRPSKQTYLGIRVHKTNLYHPQKLMRLEGREEIFCDASGNVQMEYDEHDQLVPWKIIVPTRIADVDDIPSEDDSEAPMEYSQEDIDTSRSLIEDYILAHPDDSNGIIAFNLGIPRGTVDRHAAKFRKNISV